MPRDLNLLLVLALVVCILIFAVRRKKSRTQPLTAPALETTGSILEARVTYYQNLPPGEQERFAKEVLQFLGHIRITGIKTEVTDEDRVLVAASAIIPIFAFPGWQYPNLHEVLLYPEHFDEHFDLSETNHDRRVLGMVGTGAMNNLMVLSKPSLHNGFSNKTDKHNTAIHEFVYLLDKTDGAVDGVPELLLDKHYVKPWLRLMHTQIQAIRDDRSDIDPYASVSEAEFFSVASEYFFERPALFRQKHPELYALMEKIFRQTPGTDDRRAGN